MFKSFKSQSWLVLLLMALFVSAAGAADRPNTLIMIEQAQEYLQRLGYKVSQSGELDKRTQGAISHYENRQKLIQTGEVDQVLLNHLRDNYNQQDQTAWNKAKTKDSEQSYRQYQKSHPSGKHTKEVARRLNDIKAQQQEQAKAIGKMIPIPSGSFNMGSNNGDAHEKPIHRVNIKSFNMGQTEVTFAQWDACVAARGCSHKPKDEGWGRGNRPVTNVSYNDITQQYIPWLNKVTGKTYRLPTEAEWEYAARAGSTTEYSWGNDIGRSQANCHGCGSLWGHDRTAPVKSFPANAFGLYDMHGNVWEWTEDCYNYGYRGAPTTGRAWDSGICADRVLRGGSWIDIPTYLRSAFRDWDTASSRDFSYGFRLVQGL